MGNHNEDALGTQKATCTYPLTVTSSLVKWTVAQTTADITDGTINDDQMMWKASIKFPRRITFEFSAKRNGESMSGTVKLDL